jgi:hypothetical protein
MAVLHYAYLKLKMPGNNGTNITVYGSFSRSDNCDREFQKIVAKFGIKQEVKTIDFLSKQLAPQDSKLTEVNGGKKTKKQPDDSAATTIKTTASEGKSLRRRCKFFGSNCQYSYGNYLHRLINHRHSGSYRHLGRRGSREEGPSSYLRRRVVAYDSIFIELYLQ